MSIVNRSSFIALLLVIIVGHVVLSAHVATHAADFQGGCELCTGHGDPSHAIPQSINSFEPEPKFSEPATLVEFDFFEAPFFDPRQRGPPVQI